MKRALWVLLLCTSAWAQRDTTDKILAQVYGSYLSNCTQDTDADVAASTTVNGDSDAAQAVLNVASSAGFVAGDLFIVNRGGAREEVLTVSSVGAGTITATTNLAFSHTAAQADDVKLTNRIGPLTANRRYVATCRDSSGNGLACELIQGIATVSASDQIGPTLYPGERVVIFIKGGSTYLSVMPLSSNTIVDVCPIE